MLSAASPFYGSMSSNGGVPSVKLSSNQMAVQGVNLDHFRNTPDAVRSFAAVGTGQLVCNAVRICMRTRLELARKSSQHHLEQITNLSEALFEGRNNVQIHAVRQNEVPERLSAISTLGNSTVPCVIHSKRYLREKPKQR
jgi:hypothetical protein